MTNVTPVPPRLSEIDISIEQLGLCCECGNARTVSARYRFAHSWRPLRCPACRHTTRHVDVSTGGDDYREESNAKRPLGGSE
jgi:hypothetical protein